MKVDIQELFKPGTTVKVRSGLYKGVVGIVQDPPKWNDGELRDRNCVVIEFIEPQRTKTIFKGEIWESDKLDLSGLTTHKPLDLLMVVKD